LGGEVKAITSTVARGLQGKAVGSLRNISSKRGDQPITRKDGRVVAKMFLTGRYSGKTSEKGKRETRPQLHRGKRV